MAWFNTFSAVVVECTNDPDYKKEIFGIPTWYKYLKGYRDELTNACTPLYQQSFTNSADSWTTAQTLGGVGLAIIEIMLRLIAVVAVFFVVYGGFQYLISQGEPDATKRAKDTITNALIGIVIAMSANVIVVFIGNSLIK